jgi:hypothetical protein
MKKELLEALKKHAEGQIAKHKANVLVYLNQPVGIGEHPDVMEAVEEQIGLIAKYDDHLEVLHKYFSE